MKELFKPRSWDLLSNEPSTLIKNRVTRLNALYHTHLWDDHMRSLIEFLSKDGSDFEDRIIAGDYGVVKALADRENRNCFVFATKYCSFINPEKYPIYDSIVCDALIELNKIKHFADITPWKFEKIRQGFGYSEFKKIIDAFMKAFDLDSKEFRYKDIDKFLWLVGKNIDKRNFNKNHYC